LELVVGTIMFAHGLPKLMAPASYAERMLGGIPLFLIYLVIAAEVGGGLLLLAGLLVRLAAFGHFWVMAVAVTQVHWTTGLMGPGGFEFSLTLLAASISLLVLGGSPLSIDDNLGLSLTGSRESTLRRESVDIASPTVKAAGAILILIGILLALAAIGAALAGSFWESPPAFIDAIRKLYFGLGLPGGFLWALVTLLFASAAIAAGSALVTGKFWAYLPAFVMARLCLAASALLLFYVKFAVRGIIAMILSLAMLIALRSARRGPK
jgi:putative oxidoreductase